MIIDNIEQLQELQQEVSNKEVILVPILEDEYVHYIQNKIIGYYVKVLQSTKEYTAVFNHPEAILNIDILPFLNSCTKVYCYNKVALKYNGIHTQPNIVDALMQMYLYENKIPEQTINKSAEFYARRLPVKTSAVTDVLKLQSRSRDLAANILLYKNKCESFYEELFADVFYTIESNGLKVDKKMFKEYFPETNLVGDLAYTRYNFYTATGRPSNRFGGINYAALNKEDGARECFISREEDGILLELDFQSYHPRILADIVDYKIDDSINIYEHLACYYFDTKKPTKEQIQESKDLTFKQFYGGINNKYKSIEYFNRIQNFTDLLWESFEKEGYVQSLISKRVLHKQNLEDINPTKLLNYYIQLHETEQNVVMLNKLFKELPQTIKPILYTYDSILFDLPKSEIKTLTDLFAVHIPSKFPYRIKTGLNYNSLV